MITALRSVWQLSTGRARRQHQIPSDPSLPNRMPPLLRLVLMPLLVALGSVQAAAQPLPMPPREFRAAWVATVANIDWPSKPGLPTGEQQAEIIRILDRAAALNLNALVFQVRPAADAVYESKLEPWSPYLSGTMGEPPGPVTYDPLQFIVAQAHARGLELHAWFNPYRALHKSFAGEVAENHISKLLPDAVKKYDGYQWLDPGNPRAVRHSLDVILDVVQRYDIDGVHMDDYFYPYPIKDDDGKPVPFPDDDSYAETGKGGNRDDWRRANVNGLVEQLYAEVKRAKPHVKVGISPFGIWRPGYPKSIKGFDAYHQIYADSRLWLHRGWVDYLTPQLYWTVESEGQSYPQLLEWWVGENHAARELWPGNFASRVGMQGERNWPAEELLRQIEITRATEGASGNVLFSMKSLFDDYGELGSALISGPYRQQALVPPVGTAPEDALAIDRVRPQLEKIGEQQYTVRSTKEQPWLWVVWTESNDRWKYQILPGQSDVPLKSERGQRVAVAGVNRWGYTTDAHYLETP